VEDILCLRTKYGGLRGNTLHWRKATCRYGRYLRLEDPNRGGFVISILFIEEDGPRWTAG
jgi:hypothetical protein